MDFYLLYVCKYGYGYPSPHFKPCPIPHNKLLNTNQVICVRLHQHHPQHQHQHQNYSGCMTLPKNATLMNNTASVIAEMQQHHHSSSQPPNGSIGMTMTVPRPPPPPKAKSPPESQPLLNPKPPSMRVPQAAMSEMRV